MSTCMVYDLAIAPEGIGEDHPIKPASPYAASKIAGEALTLSFFHAYGLPTTVVRPFNTYGPFQRSVGEGGVVRHDRDDLCRQFAGRARIENRLQVGAIAGDENCQFSICDFRFVILVHARFIFSNYCGCGVRCRCAGYWVNPSPTKPAKKTKPS